MKKGCLYILFFILLLNDTSLNQFLKVPALVAHFMEHHRLDERVGFVRFLAMHYGGNDMNDNDDDRDMQLPYKRVNLQSIDHPLIPAIKPAIAQHPEFTHIVAQPVFNNDVFPQPAPGSLFRPPRLNHDFLDLKDCQESIVFMAF
ncbi:MAG: hypothetical protein J7621_16840 [Niastella sp.]|nr:hypothetical protein [Niastella sp.]